MSKQPFFKNIIEDREQDEKYINTKKYCQQKLETFTIINNLLKEKVKNVITHKKMRKNIYDDETNTVVSLLIVTHDDP